MTSTGSSQAPREVARESKVAGFGEGEVDTPVTSVLFRNIGTLLSGDLALPMLDATSLLIEDGFVRAIGTVGTADVEVDVRGATVAPGLWDSHIHPYFGEYTPRQEAFGTIGTNPKGIRNREGLWNYGDRQTNLSERLRAGVIHWGWGAEHWDKAFIDYAREKHLPIMHFPHVHN